MLIVVLMIIALLSCGKLDVHVDRIFRSDLHKLRRDVSKELEWQFIFLETLEHGPDCIVD